MMIKHEKVATILSTKVKQVIEMAHGSMQETLQGQGMEFLRW